MFLEEEGSRMHYLDQFESIGDNWNLAYCSRSMASTMLGY